MSEIELADWFEWDDTLKEPYKAFLSALRRRSSQWSKLGIDSDHTMVVEIAPALVMGVDISDTDHNCVMRTLRADLYEEKVVCGHDPTHRFCGLLDLDDPECLVYESGDPLDLSDASASWFETELQRSIERHEWMIDNCQHIKWKYSSADNCFMWSDSKNRKRSGLGEPERRFVVRAFTL